ncbi:MAG: NAD-binding protein [Acidobacteriota bacterium]
MSQPEFIIFGATHIGIKLARLLAASGSRVRVLDRAAAPLEPPSGWEYVSSDFTVPEYVKDARAVYVVTEQESLNIRIALAVRSLSPQVEVIITLEQSRLGRKLARHLDRFSYLSPSELAAKQFVDCLDAPSPDQASPPIAQRQASEESSLPRKIDPLVGYAVGAAGVMACLATIYFHYAESLSWIDSLYFVVTLMATVGFGDINLKESSDLSKIIGVMLMAASVTNTAILFALVTDSLLRHRLSLAFGRRKIRDRNHVIVVGIGAVGFQVVEELICRKEKVVIVDNNPNGRFMPAIYAQGVRSVMGDARVERTLRDAGLVGAKALMSVTSDDLTNLEIALNARSLTPQLRVVLRIYNPDLAQSLRERLDIHFAFSMSRIAAEALARMVDQKQEEKSKS